MSSALDEEVLHAIAGLARALEAAAAPHMLIGGMAVIVRGVPRNTDDVDATVWAPGLAVPALMDRLRAERIEARIPDAEAFAARSQVLLLVHAPTRTPIDLSFAWLPFEQDALAHSDLLVLGPATIRVARPEDLVIYKAIAGRSRDQADIERLLRLHGASIDLARVRRIVREFSEAVDEPQWIEALDSLLSRLTGSRS